MTSKRGTNNRTCTLLHIYILFIPYTLEYKPPPPPLSKRSATFKCTLT